jgi:hypothetical protein
MMQFAPRDLRGLSLALHTSIAIWPPWNGTGDFPKWLEECRRMLARQFRAVGHRAEWHRGPRDHGVGIMSIRAVRPPAQVGKIRRELERARFGEPG